MKCDWCLCGLDFALLRRRIRSIEIAPERDWAKAERDGESIQADAGRDRMGGEIHHGDDHGLAVCTASSQAHRDRPRRNA